MRRDLLKELLEKCRYPVDCEEWPSGGDVYKVDTVPLPFTMPVVGKVGSGEYLNSGGRSLLIEYKGRAYKLKGIDPSGAIMVSYASQLVKTLIDDPKLTSEDLNELFLDDALTVALQVANGEYSVLDSGKVGMFEGGPFGVMSERHAKKEMNVLNALKEGYKRHNYLPPLKPSAIYVYNNMDFGSERVSSVLTELPLSIGSDLRLSELFQLVRKANTSTENLEKKTKEKKTNELWNIVLHWMGREARILDEGGLVTNNDSNTATNCCLRYINKDGDIGMSRVDHEQTQYGRRSEPYGFLSKVALTNFKKGWDEEPEPLNEYISAVLE